MLKNKSKKAKNSPARPRWSMEWPPSSNGISSSHEASSVRTYEAASTSVRATSPTETENVLRLSTFLDVDPPETKERGDQHPPPPQRTPRRGRSSSSSSAPPSQEEPPRRSPNVDHGAPAARFCAVAPVVPHSSGKMTIAATAPLLPRLSTSNEEQRRRSSGAPVPPDEPLSSTSTGGTMHPGFPDPPRFVPLDGSTNRGGLREYKPPLRTASCSSDAIVRTSLAGTVHHLSEIKDRSLRPLSLGGRGTARGVPRFQQKLSRGLSCPPPVQGNEESFPGLEEDKRNPWIGYRAKTKKDPRILDWNGETPALVKWCEEVKAQGNDDTRDQEWKIPKRLLFLDYYLLCTTFFYWVPKFLVFWPFLLLLFIPICYFMSLFARFVLPAAPVDRVGRESTQFRVFFYAVYIPFGAVPYFACKLLCHYLLDYFFYYLFSVPYFVGGRGQIDW